MTTSNSHLPRTIPSTLRSTSQAQNDRIEPCLSRSDPDDSNAQFSTFSASQTPMHRSTRTEQDSAAHESLRQTEDQDDEITPIVSNERGSAGHYNTSSTNSHGKSHPPATNTSAPNQASNIRKRKKKNSTGGDEQGERGVHDDEEGLGWWKSLVEKFGSIELDNKGSVARDHLALERTFLAWLRTSLAFASIGIAVTQLFRLNTTIADRNGLEPAPAPPGAVRLRQLGKPLGAVFLGIAILVLGVGGRRYFESQYWIIRGKFPASRGSVFLIAFVAFALIVTSLVLVVTIDPSQLTGD
ncbi:hypothetical protein MMC20_007513 [Loxospora ochrophaea]|nr:hypothetical protein [Loxospora ochrophaea]